MRFGTWRVLVSVVWTAGVLRRQLTGSEETSTSDDSSGCNRSAHNVTGMQSNRHMKAMHERRYPEDMDEWIGDTTLVFRYRVYADNWTVTMEKVFENLK